MPHVNLPLAYLLQFPLEFKISAKVRGLASRNQLCFSEISSQPKTVIEQIDYMALIRRGASLILLFTQPILSSNCYKPDSICYHRSSSLQLDSGFMIFWHPVTGHLCFSIGPGTWTGRTRLPLLPSSPQTVPLAHELPWRKHWVSLETRAIQNPLNVFHKKCLAICSQAQNNEVTPCASSMKRIIWKEFQQGSV